MVEGLWTIEFTSSIGSGTGVVVLTGNRLLGGDGGYYYFGQYTVTDHRMSGKAEIVRFNRNFLSVFGNMDSFTLDLEADVSEDSIEGVAHLAGQPDFTAHVQCRRKTGL